MMMMMMMSISPFGPVGCGRPVRGNIQSHRTLHRDFLAIHFVMLLGVPLDELEVCKMMRILKHVPEAIVAVVHICPQEYSVL
jgi:hypothetical protein